MAEFELARSRQDRRVYELGALGSMRLEGLMSRRAVATSAGVTWRFGYSGGRDMQALGSGGRVVGEFDSHSGKLRWNGQPFLVRPARQDRYALAAGDVEVALFEGRPWGRRSLEVEILRPEAIDPGLMLFTAFVVRSVEQR